MNGLDLLKNPAMTPYPGASQICGSRKEGQAHQELVVCVISEVVRSPVNCPSSYAVEHRVNIDQR
jgi:hypothetical protein